MVRSLRSRRLVSAIALASTSLVMTGVARADICELPASALSSEQLQQLAEQGCPPASHSSPAGSTGTVEPGAASRTAVSPDTTGGTGSSFESETGSADAGTDADPGVGASVDTGATPGDASDVSVDVGTGAASGDDPGGISVEAGQEPSTGTTEGSVDVDGGETDEGLGLDASAGPDGIDATVDDLSIGD